MKIYLVISVTSSVSFAASPVGGAVRKDEQSRTYFFFPMQYNFLIVRFSGVYLGDKLIKMLEKCKI
jgi:hypothetical protein